MKFLRNLSVVPKAMSVLVIFTGNVLADDAESDLDVALSLATMLQSARAVIGDQQAVINDASIAEKNLTGEKILGDAIARYLARNDEDPRKLEPGSRKAKLLDAQMSAIREVIEENQATINREGLGFKGFVPAVFARLVNEKFREKAGQDATIKVTAPMDLVRNRKSRPDAWEQEIIASKLTSKDWQKGEVYQEMIQVSGEDSFRVLVPEYYSEACLVCHGGPAGEIDITGYPKEGGALHDLGGVISISLFE